MKWNEGTKFALKMKWWLKRLTRFLFDLSRNKGGFEWKIYKADRCCDSESSFWRSPLIYKLFNVKFMSTVCTVWNNFNLKTLFCVSYLFVIRLSFLSIRCIYPIRNKKRQPLSAQLNWNSPHFGWLNYISGSRSKHV